MMKNTTAQRVYPTTLHLVNRHCDFRYAPDYVARWAEPTGISPPCHSPAAQIVPITESSKLSSPFSRQLFLLCLPKYWTSVEFPGRYGHAPFGHRPVHEYSTAQTTSGPTPWV